MQYQTTTADTPQNELERAMQAAQHGVLPIDDFIQQLLQSDLYVPSATEMQLDGSGLTPLFFDKMGHAMLVAFSSLERAKQYGDKAPYCLKLNGRQLMTRVPPEYGMVVNPGFTLAFDISAEGIKSGVMRHTQ